MMNFLVKYLATAALLAVAGWIGVPMLKTHLENAGKPPLATTSATVAARAAEPKRQDAPNAQHAQPTEPPASVAETVPQTPVPSPAPQTASAPEPTIVETPAPPPEPTPVKTGPVYNWGVLAEEAQAYNEEGKPRVKLPAGTVIEKTGERDSSGGRLLVCRVLNNRRWERGFMVKASSAVMFDCPYEEAPKDARTKITRYFTLKGFIATRTAALREEHVKRNPYFSAYQKAAKEYNEFKDKAKELTTQRDAAQGAARTQLASQLERMKSEEVQLRAAFEKAEAPYKKWKAEHGDGAMDIMNDEQIGQWNDEIDELHQDVSDYIPDL